MLMGMLLIKGGRSVCSGGGACIIELGNVILVQCFTWGPVYFLEDIEIQDLKK